ncbi:lipoprotein, putative [Pseudomonas sessilinigenes]|nr:lipoprotein, putative [Pseudomonas sessilinigenes]
MTRRIALLLVMATLLSLGGCVVYPGHYHHCCYRYGYYR